MKKNINFKVLNDTFVLKIIDTSGSEKFYDIIKQECLNTHFVLVVFDVTNKDSFTSVEKWINLCLSSENTNLKFIIVGNKNDLNGERKVRIDEANSFAIRKNMKYYDISAFKDEDVKTIFNEAFNSFYGEFSQNLNNGNYRRTIINTDKIITIKIENKKENKQKSCNC